MCKLFEKNEKTRFVLRFLCKSIAKNRRYVNAFGIGKKKTLRFAYMLFGHEKHPRIS